jgi:PAS domain S-box-containing protein
MSQNEAVLIDQPEYLDALLVDNVEHLLGLLDEEGVVVRANRSLASLCAAPRVELIGQAFWSGRWCEAVGLSREQIRRAVAAAARGQGGRLTGAGAGQRVDLSFKPVVDHSRHAASGVLYVAVEGRVEPDVLLAPARDRLQPAPNDAEAMQRQLAAMAQIYQRAPIGLALVDCGFRFVHVNQRLADMNGFPPHAHVGRNLREIVPDLADSIEVLYQAVLEGGEEVHGMILRGRTAKHAEIDRQWTLDLYPCLGDDGRIIGAIAAVSETTDVARAERARQEREQQLKAFFDSAPVGLFVLDHKLRYRRVNEPLAAIHGIPVDEHLGRSVDTVDSPFARAIETSYRAFLEGRTAPCTLDLAGERPAMAGTRRHWTVSCFPIDRGSHQSVWLGGLVLDVTEARQTKQALFRRTEDLANAQALARLTHWELPVDGGEVRWPDEIWELAGYRADQLAHIERDGATLFAADSRPAAEAALQRAIRTAEPFQLDVELVLAGGEHLWITTRGEPETDRDGRVARLRGIAQDITERKCAELALRDSEQRFQQAFSHAPIGMELVDATGLILSVNPALCELFGYGKPELLAMTLSQLTHPEDVEREAALFRRLIDGEIPSYELEQRAIRKDGRTVWTLVSRTLVTNETGSAPYVISQLLDITERKQVTARVLKLSRLYAAISETNKAIVRGDTPEDVYRAVCNAGVEYGGFHLAWIGVADPEVERIVPVEAAGPAVGFLDDIVVSTREDTPGGRGPTGRAYREQRVCQCRDLMTDPYLAPRDGSCSGGAVAHGLECAISLPLRRGGEPFGTFTVYGHDENFFDGEAVQLLQDMADSVSFALDFFDRENLRRQTDAALRASEARLQEAQAVSKMGDWELDRDTGKMTWSTQLFRLFERRVELGAPDLNEALAYFTPESLDETRDCFWHVIDTGERSELEQVVILPSGRLRYHATLIVPVESSSGRVVKLYGTVQDITERKLAERELIRRTEEVEDLYQNAPCGYHSLDADARIIRINDTELQWLGYGRAEVFGRLTAMDILTPESRILFENDFRQLKGGGVSRTLELDLLRKDGSTLPVLASSTALFNSNGTFIAARTVLANNTHRKQLESERAAYVARLAELSRHLVDVQENERRQLAGELHDQASPNLAALRITFSNLASALPPPVMAEVEPLLDDAHALLHDTTEGIRDICTNLRPATLDYAGLIPALHEYAEPFGRRTGITVVIDHENFRAELLPNVQSLLFRITQEALTNCSKHALARNIRIRLADTDDDVTLTISDDGVGFEPDSLGEAGSAPGLGLITMKERAEFAGGHFDLRSCPGKGTEIRVVFEKRANTRTQPIRGSVHDRGFRSDGPSA